MFLGVLCSASADSTHVVLQGDAGSPRYLQGTAGAGVGQRHRAGGAGGSTGRSRAGRMEAGLTSAGGQRADEWSLMLDQLGFLC